MLFTYVQNFSRLVFFRIEEDNIKISTLAESLVQSDYYLPGLHPGYQTEMYLFMVMKRITLIGALGMAFLAAGLPYLILILTQQNVIVSILSLMVAVETFVRWRADLQMHMLSESFYEDIVRKSLHTDLLPGFYKNPRRV